MAHMKAPEKEALLEIVHTLDDEMRSERPEHSRLDKLICLKVTSAPLDSRAFINQLRTQPCIPSVHVLSSNQACDGSV